MWYLRKLMEASMRWPAIRPAAWVWSTTLDVTGAQRQEFQSSTYPDVLFSPITSGDGAVLALPGSRFSPDDPVGPSTSTHLAVFEDCARGRAGYYEQADFAIAYGSTKCRAKPGCWGPVVNCSIQTRLDGGNGRLSECGRNLHRVYDARLPGQIHAVYDEPPGARVSAGVVGLYGRAIVALRGLTNSTLNKEPKWRHPGTELTTGYRPSAY